MTCSRLVRGCVLVGFLDRHSLVVGACVLRGTEDHIHCVGGRILAGVEVGVPWLMMCGICCGFCALFAVGNQCVTPIGL